MCGDETDAHTVLGQRLNQSQGLNPKRKSGVSVSVKKCGSCKLIYASPQPIPFDIQDHYGAPPEDYWKPDYFEWTPKYFEEQIRTVKSLLPFYNGMTALDVGAGIGKCMISLNNAGFETYGLEPSEPYYKRALSEMKIDPSTLKLGKVEELHYQEVFFDFITFGAVFEHLYHPANSLQKVLEWLKPNGIIHIEVPSSEHFMAKIINLYFKIRGTNYVTNISPMHPPFHLYEFGFESFEKLAGKLNYSVEHHCYNVCSIQHVPKVLHPFLRTYMKLTNTGMQLTVYLRKKSIQQRAGI